MGELKPCPFCGSDNVSHFSVAGIGVAVGCGACGSATEVGSDESTAEKWNRRTPPQPVTPAGGEVDRLIDAAHRYYRHYCLDEAGDDMGENGRGLWTGCTPEQHEDAKELGAAVIAALNQRGGG